MKFTIPITKRAIDIVADMDVESLLHQIACPQIFTGRETPSTNSSGALFFHASSRVELAADIDKYKSVCTLPPLITTDMESGPGDMITDGTKFPSLMSAGVAGDEKLAYEMGKAAAIEGRYAGFNWSLSPCADVAAIADSPMVSLRSAGNDFDTVIKITSAYIKGLQENGMIATAKHFPGDGFDIYDQHLTVPQNPQSEDEWKNGSGKVFQKLIDDGVMAVMPGHISLPAFDEIDSRTGFYPPASISKKLLTTLLKEKMGFDGLIVSDAVNMGGFAGYINRFDATAEFLEAGGDIVLFPHPEYFVKEMKIRLENGMIKKETLINRARRVVSLKDKLGLLDDNIKSPVKPDKKYHEKISKKIVDKCVRVIRDRDNILPVKIEKTTRIAHVVISMHPNDETHLYDALENELKTISNNVERLVYDYPEGIFERVYGKEFDLVICSISAKHDYGTNVARLSGPAARLMMTGWMKLGTPVIFINHFHPFITSEYKFSTDTIINTFGSTVYSMKRVVLGITGLQPFLSE
ncbi:MAG: hypothetical protein JXR91_01425 [Deltaproteobacteria bacterium]|nr:hypothetical protein [Deltaproteobacteria bacterium]